MFFLSPPAASTVWFVVVVVCLWSSTTTTVVVVNAAKDDTYYAAGTVNPNLLLLHNMYWKEPYNVLQDLSQFDKLYLQYHGCVWSEVWDNNNNNNNNNNNDNGNGQQQQEVEESDQWYYNAVPPFGANVAYSLYGRLKDEQDEEDERDDGCHRGTYINSFVTTGGIQSFMTTLGLLGLDEFIVVSDVGNGDGEEEEEGQQQQNDDDVDDDNAAAMGWSQLTSTCSASSSSMYGYSYGEENTNSYALACSSSSSTNQWRMRSSGYSFALVEFEDSSSCYGGSHVVQIVDALDEFNSVLTNQVTCVELYNVVAAAAANGNNNNNNNNGEQENNNNNNDGENEYEPYQLLLQNSRACSSRDGTACPDPYGKRSAYQRALDRATQAVYYPTVHWKRILSWCMVTAGLVCILVTIVTSVHTCYHSYNKYQQRQRKRQQQPPRRRGRRRKRGAHVEPQESTQVEAEYYEPPAKNNDGDGDDITESNDDKYDDDDDASVLPPSMSNEIAISQSDSFTRDISRLTAATGMTRGTNNNNDANAPSSSSPPSASTKPTGKFTRWLRRKRLMGRKPRK